MFFGLYKALCLGCWLFLLRPDGLFLLSEERMDFLLNMALKLHWWRGKQSTNCDQSFYEISTPCVRVGRVSDYQRTSVLVSPKHKMKIYRRYALNYCQPKSRIHSQLVGNAKSNSFKSYLNLAFYEGWISVTGLVLLPVVGHNSSGCSFTRTLLVYSILKFIGLWLFVRQQQVTRVFTVPICKSVRGYNEGRDNV